MFLWNCYRDKLKKKTVAHLLNKTNVDGTGSAKNGAMNGTTGAISISDSDSDDSDSSHPETMETCSSAGPVKVTPDLTEDGRSNSPRPETAAKLPDSVDGSLLAAIEAIKLAAKDSSDGKQKFFKGRVNDLLLQ